MILLDDVVFKYKQYIFIDTVFNVKFNLNANHSWRCYGLRCNIGSIAHIPLYIVENFIWKRKQQKTKWKCKVNVYHRQSSNFNLKINNICGEIVYFQNGFMAKQSPLAMYTVRFIFFFFLILVSKLAQPKRTSKLLKAIESTIL